MRESFPSKRTDINGYVEKIEKTKAIEEKKKAKEEAKKGNSFFFYDIRYREKERTPIYILRFFFFFTFFRALFF